MKLVKEMVLEVSCLSLKLKFKISMADILFSADSHKSIASNPLGGMKTNMIL